jgi:RimJ/RimL family protein N-acetyltransferase
LPSKGVSGQDGRVETHGGRVETAEIRAGELLLRRWRPGDAAAVTRACQDPWLRHWAPSLPSPYTGEDGRQFVEEIAPQAWAERTHLGFVAVDARTGEMLASVAIHNPDTAPELGYWSAPWARGGRICERASRPLLRWAFDELGADQVGWKATVGNHASRLTGLRLGFRMIGRTPATTKTPERWVATLLPGDLTAEGTELDPAVRKQARIFGTAPPTLDAGQVRLRPPARRDLTGILVAHQDPQIVRWFGVAQPYTEADARRYIEQEAPQEWARGAEAIFVIAGPDDSYAGSVDLRVSAADPAVGEVGFLVAPQARGRGQATAAVRALVEWGITELGLVRIQWRAEVGNDASRRVAEKAGFTMEGLVRQGYDQDGRRRDCWIGSLLATDRVHQ